ncbi:MAG: AMP-binding protein [Flavobacteriaceae bacterium]
MAPNFKNVHNRFKLNGYHYTYESLMEVAYSFVKEGVPFEQAIGEFLLQWLDYNDFIEVNTSGSTGAPKIIKLSKQAMVNSALATGNFFNLHPGDKALYCLPTSYIAGKMMLVRAFILGLEIDIIQPTTQLKIDADVNYNFCAMTPMLLEHNLDKIGNIQTIIVGGAPISNVLKTQIENISTNIYETYGMTETVSHIALKKLNGFSVEEETDNYFKALPNINISTDERDCLVIEAPHLSEKKVITNDIVKWHSETEFEWLGRYDNVINSGGVKLFPEQIEAKLQSKINARFFITALPDTSLGQQVVLVVEQKNNQINTDIFSVLDKFEKPKTIYNIPIFEETLSGKVQRQETLKKILEKV